ncbi:hypothetical protein USB125703_01906 [Pseudoclavibacter triregionum]|nr:hypothetical protein USB125703_01906 [Pseudoclavibacter triregionum]
MTRRQTCSSHRIPSSRRPRLAIAGLLAAASLALAGCTAVPQSAESPEACEALGMPGAASEAVRASGAFGQALAAELDGPVATDILEISRSGAGHGPIAAEAGVLAASFAVFDASGAPIVPYGPFSSAADGTSKPLTMTSLGAQLPGAAAALRCAQAGERIIAAMPASMLLGDGAERVVDDPATTLLFAADVERVYPSSAGGRILPAQDGIPAVVTSPAGRPGATMPQSAPPTALRTALRVEGFGDPIRAGDALTLHASIFDWESGEEIASTWEAGNTVISTVAGGDANGEDGLYGVTAELVGKPEGSQLIAVVPTELALSRQGPLAPSVATGRTLVLVLDVLAADRSA